MNESFTSADFLAVFERYNTAVGLAPLALLGLALLALRAIALDWSHRDACVRGVLAALWIWSGIAYHWAFFADVNPAAPLFGALFVGEGAAFALVGLWRHELSFSLPRKDARGVAGWLVLGYAMVIYPLVSVAAGHAWPKMPTFGTPCPVGLFTCGLLLWAKGPVPKLLLLVPVTWAVLATIAAIELGMSEDWGLLIAVSVLLRLLPGRNAAPNPTGPDGHTTSAIPHRIWHHAHRK